MKRAFPWLLQTFLLAFALLLVTQIVVDAAGLSLILDRYAKGQRQRLEDLAREILLDPTSVTSGSLSFSNSFFIFSVDKNHLFRGSVTPAEFGTRIEISNDGPDIPEEQTEKVFQRLYRGEFARNTPGSGLGLSIAQEIIHRHGGTIAVRPLPPRGVRFVVTLPFIPSSP